MKIAQILPPFVEVPPKNYGGTERRIETLTKTLIKQGHEVTLYCAGESKTRIPKKAICEIALFNDSTYTHSKDRLERISKINNKTIELLKQESPEIIHCHDYDNPDLADKLSKIGIPALITIRYHDSPLVMETYNSNKDKENIYFCGLSQSQVNVIDPELKFIYNGEDPKNYPFLKSNLEKRAFFLSLGDTLPRKGIKSAIDLAKRVKKDLVIAGEPIYSESKEYFQNEIEPFIDLDISKEKNKFIKLVKSGKFKFDKGNIIYFGLANEKQKLELYQRAQFMQFLGNLEVSGNKDACPGTPIESSLCGTPVLGVKGNISDELVDHGITGVNIASLEEAIRAVPFLEKMNPKRIRERAVEKFSIENVAKKFTNFYEEILEGRFK